MKLVLVAVVVISAAAPSVQAQIRDPNHAQPMCATKACGEVAEHAARQAYDTCRNGAGSPDLCTQKALDAWLATGAIPPYAHPCTATGAAVVNDPSCPCERAPLMRAVLSPLPFDEPEER